MLIKVNLSYTQQISIMTLFSEIRPVTLREQIVDQVRTAIIEGRLKPADHVTEITLTKYLGVSRTPVREALILLEREGLLDFIPNRGYFVRVFTERDVREIFLLRTALENLAAELAIPHLNEEHYAYLERLISDQTAAIEHGEMRDVRRIDMNFHQYLVEASGHTLLYKNWRSIVAQIAALLYIRAEAFPNYDELIVIGDHKAILNAYRSGNPANVSLVNAQINARVADMCIAGLKNSE
jgi:DNA-binding GntR family transcriptional regulator